ncbi:MAG TPA: lytic murein transglycosylase B [Janthinobacterium sp.]|nr:lytic murein transglycosylase B [Janthinobacterium sp.]
MPFSIRRRPLLILPLTLSLLLAGAPPAQAREAGPAPAAKKAAVKTVKKKKTRAAKKAAPAFDYTGEFVDFGAWKEVRAFLDDVAARDGFDRAALDQLIGQVRYVETAVQLIKPAPPGKPKNWQAYSRLFIEPVRIDGGVKFWNENAAALDRAENEYGIPAEIIVGIIGVETVYGRNTGRFRVLDALTTLAFSYPEAPARAARMAFFRNELENALLFARQNNIDPLSLMGSYAGAVGLPQFMPSNILKYAVDYDGDGHIDLRNSSADAIGSVAHFLVAHGWRRNDPGAIVYPATVSPSRAWEPFIGQGLEAKFRQEDLLAAGVTTNAALPPGTLFGLVDLQNGSEPTEYCLGTNNFYAITQYNRSFFYAMSVIELGRAVKMSRGL